VEVTREHVLRVADLAGLDERARRDLLAVHYPDDIERVRLIFDHAGAALGYRVDWMGGGL